MSEVNTVSSITPVTGRVVTVVKAPAGEVDPVEKAVAANLVEQQPAEQEQKLEKPDAEELRQAVATMNDYVQSIQRDLQFSVDEELNQTVVKVIDSKSGEVIRQIPDETLLELARNLAKDGRVQLLDASG